MKKSFKVFALSLVAVSALFACSKEMDVINDKPAVEGNKTILTINATNPESVATKTTMEGTKPSWLAGDKITVIYKNKSNAVATTESTPLGSNSSSASFEAELVEANTSINGYAVYPANALSQTLSVAKIPIAAEQHPTGTAFDGTSDIMVSEAFTPAGTVSTRFARLGAILRVKVSNATLNDEKILSLSVTAESNLVGDASVSLSEATLTGLTGGSATVTATYEPANQFTVGAAEKYVYLIVYPQELAAGTTLTIGGETENYTFSRDIELPNKIVLNPGHIVPLSISITDSHIAQKLPFDGNLDSWVTSTANYEIDLDDANGLFIDKSKVYGSDDGELKFGTSSARGSITTKYLNLSGPFKVIVSAKYYKDGEAPKIKVTPGSATAKTSSATTSSYTNYEFSFSAGSCTGRDCIVIETVDANRCYINSIQVVSEIPVLDTPANVVAVGGTDDITVEWEDVNHADSYTVSYSGASSGSISVDPGDEIALFDDLGTGVYTVSVRAISADHSAYLDSEVATVNPVVVGTVQLATPSNVSIVQTANGFTAEWDEVDYATSYEWELSTSSTFDPSGTFAFGDDVLLNELEALFTNTTTITWADDKFTVGDTYYFRVKAKNALFSDSTWGTDSFEVLSSESVVYTLTPAAGTNTSYTGNCDVTIEGITWNVEGNSNYQVDKVFQGVWRVGGKNITNTNRAIYSKTALSNNISKIVITTGAANITVNSLTVIVATNSTFSSVVSTLTPAFAADNTITVNRPDGKDWSNCYYKFVFNVTNTTNSNKYATLTEVEFTGR